MRNWEFREFHVKVNLPFPIWQVWVPIHQLIPSIHGLLNPILQVIPLITHIRLYPPYHYHLDPPSHCVIHNSTIIREHTVKWSLSISRCHGHWLTLRKASTEYSIHQVQHTPSTAYTKYSFHQVQHTASTTYTEYSIHRVQHTPSPAYTESSIHRVQHTPSPAYTESSIHRVQHSPSTAFTAYSIHRVQHSPSTAFTEYSIHRVQHSPSTAYTKYSIHLVQHTLSTAYTEDTLHHVQYSPSIVCLPMILMIMSWPQKLPSGCSVPPYKTDPHQASHDESLKVMSPHPIPMVASWLTDQ